MTQQIIDVGAAANDGTGEPLRNAFTAVNDNFTQIWTAGPVGSQVKISGNIVTTTVTNLGLTLAGNGIGNITANSTIVPGTPGVYDLGAPDRTFQYIYGDYLVGNGALITGIVANTSYNNSNVAAFLPTYTGNLVSLTGPVRTTANVIAGNIITSGFLGVSGNISGGNITGVNLISSGSVSAVGNIATAGNISGNYLLGNGAFITGITATNIAAGALTGTTLSSNVLYSSLKVVDDLLYLDVIGNVTTQGRFIGSGAGLTNIPGANVTGQVANALVAGTVYTNAQPNITSVGTLTSLTATGNIAGNYFIGNGALLTGISASSVNANALVGDVLSSNVLYSSLKVVDDLLYLDVIGNVTTQGRFIGSGAGLINIPAANITGVVANATYATTAGTAYSVAGANVTGTVANATYATTAGSATSANTATTATYANTANAVAGANVSGTVANATYATTAGSATTATTATTAGTVTTAVQPNITSVGTLTSVSVSGNATAGNILTGGTISAVGNITGNYFIGNGSQLTGVAASNVRANALIGDVLSSNVLYSSLKVVDDLLYLDVIGNVTGNYFIGNGSLLTGVVATGIGTLASLSVTGNTQTGNLLTGGMISAVGNIKTTGNVSGNYFIGNGAGLTGIIASAGAAIINGNSNVTVNANGNITVGAIGTSNVAVFAPTGAYVIGEVSATGNVTGNYLLGNGAFITGLPAGYSNADVANYLPTYSGNLVSLTGPVTTTSNITGGNVVTGGLVSATGNVTGGGVVTTGPSGNISGANVISATTFTATANITGGNILTVGLVSATGNVYGNAIRSDNYCYANGVPIPTGIVYTAATSPPAGPDVGDQWYDTASDVLYEFINDGTSTYWVDTTSPAFAGGVVANVAISGTLVPVANVTYDIGTNSVYFRNTYTQNLYTNNRLPGYNMPLGAVIQTVMSSSLGGSTTNSTGYADISYANVTITPSSATSKVLIIATGTSEFSAVSGFGVTSYTQLVRGASTSLQVQNTGTSGTGGTDAGAIGAISYSYMDAPATASAVTYKLQQKVSTASSTLTSTNIWLIAMEIAAS